MFIPPIVSCSACLGAWETKITQIIQQINFNFFHSITDLMLSKKTLIKIAKTIRLRSRLILTTVESALKANVFARMIALGENFTFDIFANIYTRST